MQEMREINAIARALKAERRLFSNCLLVGSLQCHSAIFRHAFISAVVIISSAVSVIVFHCVAFHRPCLCVYHLVDHVDLRRDDDRLTERNDGRRAVDLDLGEPA